MGLTSNIQKLGIIPARLESRRLPQKLLTHIGDKPLLQWTYENALESTLLDEVVIAVDHVDLERAAKNFGAQVYLTSSDHRSGTDRAAEVVEKYFPDAEIVVNIQGDEPCLDPSVIDTLIQGLESYTMATAVAQIGDPSHIFDPATVKCVFNARNEALYFSRAPIPFPYTTDQIHTYYKHLGVYAFRASFLKRMAHLSASRLQKIEDLEQLKVLEYGEPIHVCLVKDQSIGVDTAEDLEKVKELLCQKSISL